MPHYRATIRFGRPQRYHMEDVDAVDLAEALRVLAERFPAEVRDTADLVEIRVQAGPDDRVYTAG